MPVCCCLCRCLFAAAWHATHSRPTCSRFVRAARPPDHAWRRSRPTCPCSSEFAEHFHDAEGFGWAKAAPPVDVKKLIGRKASRLLFLRVLLFH